MYLQNNGLLSFKYPSKKSIHKIATRKGKYSFHNSKIMTFDFLFVFTKKIKTK